MLDPFQNTRARLGDYRATATAAAAAPAPVVQAEAPDGGGPVWVVTDGALARQVLTDVRITKDPASAPVHWKTWQLGLEPPAAQQPSLTTADGPSHVRMRRAHAPLFTARRLGQQAGRIAETAGDLLRELAVTGPGPVDLTADFTTRYPLTVICELLGVPVQYLDDLAAACRRMTAGEPADTVEGMATLNRLVGTALTAGTPATELRDRLPASYSEEDVRYLLFGLAFAAQVTTESALGFLVAHLLGDPAYSGSDPEALVQDVLRRYPPAPFTLWRFTTTEVELAGTVVPPRSPVLVAIAGNDLTFGAGPHYCIGAQLALLELTAVAEVMREHFPRARLAVPFDDLPVLDLGIAGLRLAQVPVRLS
jgi:cytochrome P450